MVRPAYFLCAQQFAVDKFTNGVIAINLLDTLPLPTFPFWIPTLVVGVTLRRDRGDPDTIDGELLVQLAEQEITRAPVNVDFQGTLGCNLFLGLHGLRVPNPGEIEFRLRLPGIPDAIYTIRVMAPEPQQNEAPIAAQPIVQPRSESDAPVPAAS
jgi:hypothetical protein